MAELSDYAENAILNYILRNTGTPTTVTVCIALYTTDPTDADTGTEVSTGGYVRQSMAFDAASGGSCSNSSLVSFTASGASWGSITHVAIFDASTVGNMLYHSPMDTARTVNDGDTIEFAAASVACSLT